MWIIVRAGAAIGRRVGHQVALLLIVVHKLIFVIGFQLKTRYIYQIDFGFYYCQYMFVLLQDEENYNSERGISEWIRMKTLEEN